MDASQAAKAKEAYRNRQSSSKTNRWGAKVEPQKSTTTSSNERKRTFEEVPKRDTSFCKNPHKIRFKWDNHKFK